MGDRGEKTIAPAVHGGDEAGRLRRVAQGPAHLADGDAYHGIADGRLGPDGVQQGVFSDQPVGMGDQVVQHVEGFGRQGKGLRPTPETGVVRIEAKIGEAPLAGGHPRPPLLPRGGSSRQRGIKTHDTTAALHRHGKTLRL